MTAYDGLSNNEPWYTSLQGNILKPNGRNQHRIILLTFAGSDVGERAREWLRTLPVTSFRKQLDDAAAYRDGRPSDLFLSVLLSASGFEALGYPADRIPSDPAFRAGMKAVGSRFGDPAHENWDEPHRGRIDAVLLLGDDDPTRLASETDRLVAEARGRIGPQAVLGVDSGQTRRDADQLAREPFGFRDGLSNPLFLDEDITRAAAGGADRFDDRALKETVLVPDPNAPGAYGSYVVVRKLEQNVRRFRNAEHALAASLGLSSADAERAAAMVMGRFRDGTPLASAASPAGDVDGLNNFNFADDPRGARCPFHAHVRKANDRGESVRTGAGFGDERLRRIVRRGFTYADSPISFLGLDVEEDAALPVDQLPERGLGTMFLGYQSSIRDQFEHILDRFMHNTDYFVPHSGVDALVGKHQPAPEAGKWARTWGDAASLMQATFDECVTLRGGEYLYAPSLDALRSVPATASARPSRPVGSTDRTRRLRQSIVNRAFENRRDEWFTPEMLPHVLERQPDLASAPVITRQAAACRVMLRAMANAKNSERTRTFEIRQDELVVGTMPMGSVGLGKTFPGYLTKDEARASSLSNRDEGSVFAHTIPNFRRVLDNGLEGVIRDCRERSGGKATDEQRVFYAAVVESCEAVVEYADAFAALADTAAQEANTAARRAELQEIARVCRKVPRRKADTFHEALQCIWFVHLAETAFCAFNSLGRLDQVLADYLDKDLIDGRITESQAVELLECFLIKGAERLNLNPTTLRDQDFLTFGTGIGTQPIYLDQIASCNNFIQNIMLGGVDRAGKDATRKSTLLFLEALGGVGLGTPTVNVRLHNGSPPELLEAIDRAFRRAGSGHPILFNDESVVPGLVDAGLPLAEACDFAVAGCWEPMLHGKNSFIFGMVNMLRVLECSLNQGTLFSSDPQFLIGQKQSWRSPAPDEYTSFEHLMAEVERHARFFADKIALGTCSFFVLPSAMTPTPFMSMLLDGCLERGIDQSRGGADYNIIANLAFAVPNTANALANIKKYVFEERRWTLSEVAGALKANWGMSPVRTEYESNPVADGELREKYTAMRRTFVEQGPKFGNNGACVDAIARRLMDIWYGACKGAEALARKAFLSEPGNAEAGTLRTMANYPAPSFKEALRADFEIHFTSGSGTFGQYSSMGKGVSASADGRAANESLVPNCSPMAGTAVSGIDAALRSIGSLGLDRFGCAVVTDIRIDGTDQEPGFFADLARRWVAAGGSMMTVSVLSTAEVAEMLRLSDRVRLAPNQIESLRAYADRFCRVGGWNSGYVCLPRPQQRDHLLRAQW